LQGRDKRVAVNPPCVSAEGANPFPAGADETLRQKDSAADFLLENAAPAATDGANLFCSVSS